MPIPEYQHSSGAVIFRMTPEERLLAETQKAATDAKAHSTKVQKDYNKLQGDYESLNKKYNKLLEHLGLDPEDLE